MSYGLDEKKNWSKGLNHIFCFWNGKGNLIPFCVLYFNFYCVFFFVPQCVAMERKRGLIPSPRANKRGKTGKEKVDEVEIQELSPSFADLPFPIATDILLRLPIKSVLICKCVCRNWNTVISDPHFAKVHFERSPYGFLILTCDRRFVSRTNLTVNATTVIWSSPFKLHIYGVKIGCG